MSDEVEHVDSVKNKNVKCKGMRSEKPKMNKKTNKVKLKRQRL